MYISTNSTYGKYSVTGTSDVASTPSVTDTSGVTNTPSVTGTSDVTDSSNTTGVTNSTTKDLNIIASLVDKFARGNLTRDELIAKLENLGITPEVVMDNNDTTVSFTFDNRSYYIKCSNVASVSSKDNERCSIYSLSLLKSSYRFNETIINEYFEIVAQETKDGESTNTKYRFKKDAPFKTPSELRTYLYNQAKEELALINFLNGNYRTTVDNANGLLKIGNVTLTSSNFVDYLDEIKKLSGGNLEQLKSEVIKKLAYSTEKLPLKQLILLFEALDVEYSQGSAGNYITANIDGQSMILSSKTNNAGDKFNENAHARQQYAMDEVSRTIDEIYSRYGEAGDLNTNQLVKDYEECKINKQEFDLELRKLANDLIQQIQEKRQEKINKMFSSIQSFTNDANELNKIKEKYIDLVTKFVNGLLTEAEFDSAIGGLLEFDEKIYQDQINNYYDDIKTYDLNTANAFKSTANNLVLQCFNGNITLKELDEQLKAEYDKSLPVAKDIREKAYQDQINNYYDDIKTYDLNTATAFKSTANNLVQQSFNGGITLKELDEQLKAEYEKSLSVAKDIREKNDRSNYVSAKVKEWTDKLAKNGIPADSYKSRATEYNDDYINGKLSQSDYDKCLNNLYNTIINEYNRSNYVKTKVKEWTDKLAENDIPADRYKSRATEYNNDYINGKLSQTDYDNCLKTLYNTITNEYAKERKSLETTKTSKKGDGSNVVQTYDYKGRLKAETYNDKDGYKTKTVSITYRLNGSMKTKTEQEYDKSGKVTRKVVYNYDNSSKLTTRVTTEYHEDGSYTKFTYTASNGTSKRVDYDKNGKALPSGYNQVDKGKITKSKSVFGITVTRTLTTQQLYNAITQNLDKTLISFKGIITYSTREVIAMAVSPATWTTALLEASQVGKGAPTGATKINSLKASGYEETLRRKLESVRENYGYEPEDIQGYKFGADSAFSKAIATNDETKTFVKNNIKDLVNGTNLPKALKFTKGDLYYAISQSEVIDSKLNGMTLTLTVCDVYDFDPKYIDKLTDKTSSTGTILNAAGAAAMKDGKLKPYYWISTVSINLASLGYTQAQINKMKA